MIDIDNLQGIIEFQMESDFKRLRSTCGTSMEDNASSLSFGDTIELITRLREAERDAARYRWLVDNSVFGMKQNGVSWSLSFDGPAPDHSGKIGEYIDQAMKEKGDE